MSRTSIYALPALVVATALLAGCESSGGADPMSMTPPERPAALDKLQVMVGTWEGTAECKMGGSNEVMKSTGRSVITWEADRRALLERSEMTMGDQKMAGLGLWTYDPKRNVYPTFWADSWGSISHGDATFDEATRTWDMSWKSRNPATGESTVGGGKARMVNNDTMEWDFTEWNAWKTQKQMEMKGTTRRVK